MPILVKLSPMFVVPFAPISARVFVTMALLTASKPASM